MAVKFCLLSVEEAARLEHWSIWPCCYKTGKPKLNRDEKFASHRHISRLEAEMMVSVETHRLVGGADTCVSSAGPITAIVPVNVGGMWSPVAAGLETGEALMGFRTWGLQKTG
jgi:hypothetical protein